MMLFIFSISTPNENEEKFQKLMKFLDLDLTKQQIMSARNYFNNGHPIDWEHGFRHHDGIRQESCSLSASKNDCSH
jgi:hypothetical protein